MEELSRISKLFVDRDETAAEDVLTRRRGYTVTLHCGDDVAGSYNLQLAVLTAAALANRCFPGAIRVALPAARADAPLLIWPSLRQTFHQALTTLVAPGAIIDSRNGTESSAGVVFGDAPAIRGALRATFDGWIAKVGPAAEIERLPERDYCSLAAVLAGSLAVAEVFFSFAEISVAAGHRTVALSLWRPGADISDPEALGVQVEFLPCDLWMLGLGHLGNAYIWSLTTLPYRDPEAVEIVLNDFDKIEPPNIETGVLFTGEDLGRYKTRTCSEWLEKRGFRTRLVERRFDSNFRCRVDEPRLALCGFDQNPPRRDLATADFLRVVESGLGGQPCNFDTMALHTLPNPRTAHELWPDLTPEEEAKHASRQKQAAQQNPAYTPLAKDECGRYELAGKSVAVPFVGATASTLVVAEHLRLLHKGPAYTDIKLTLSALNNCVAQSARDYGASDFVGLNFTEAALP